MTDIVTNHYNVDLQRTGRRRTVAAVFKNRLLRVGAAIVILLALLALAAPMLTHLNVLHKRMEQDPNWPPWIPLKESATQQKVNPER